MDSVDSVRLRGKLARWNDDRGFGFIQPEQGGAQVFLHIRALKPAVRRPQVGDTIFYDLAEETQGKVRASNASIAGVAMRPAARKPARQQRGWLEPVFGIAVGAAVVLFVVLRPDSGRVSPSGSTPPQVRAAPPPGYAIKGNVSVNTGARIYHVPGSEDYEATVIDTSRGERWFRTEAEAVASGWRRAPR